MILHQGARLRESAHRAFARIGRSIGRTPRRYALAVLALTALLVAHLPQLRVDTTFEGMLPVEDPTRQTFEAFREQFGSTERAILAVRAPTGLFESGFMERLAALHADLEANVPMQKGVTSLLNARWTRGEDDRLIVEDFMAVWPEDAAGWVERERRALENPLYRDLFVSGDGQWTLVIVEPDPYTSLLEDSGSDALEWQDGFARGVKNESVAANGAGLSTEEMIAIARSIDEVAARHRSQELEIRVGGGIVMAALLGAGIEHDFGRLLGLAIAVIAVLLYVIFRSGSCVLLALSVVLLSLASSVGLMAWIGIPLDVGTQILPAFLLAVGIGYSVHVLTIFKQWYRETGDKRVSVVASLDHSGLAIVMTALTTMGGLFAFAFADLVPLQRIGLFAPVGVALSMIYSLVLLPALLVLLPISPPPSRAQRQVAERVLVRLGVLSVAHRRTVLLVLVGLLAISAVGISRVRLSHNPLAWLPESSEFRRANAVLDEQFGGAYQLELLVRAREGRDLRGPAALQAMDSLANELLTIRSGEIATRKVIGLHDVAKEIHRALHDDDPAEYVVTDDPQLLGQELLLFESSGSDDLETLADGRYETARMSVRVRYADSYLMTPYIESVDRAANRHLGDTARVESTGLFGISHRVFSTLVDSMLRSYVIAMVLIGAFMMLLIGRPREGLAALVPNLSPIILTLGFMGFAGIPLGLFTLLVGNIALGLAVDDTIHFVHGYLRDRDATGDSLGAVRRTLSTTGTALLFTSTALVAGFGVFAFASLENLLAFGLLASLSIALAFLADVLVSPGLMVWVGERSDGRARDERPASGFRAAWVAR